MIGPQNGVWPLAPAAVAVLPVPLASGNALGMGKHTSSSDTRSQADSWLVGSRGTLVSGRWLLTWQTQVAPRSARRAQQSMMGRGRGMASCRQADVSRARHEAEQGGAEPRQSGSGFSMRCLQGLTHLRHAQLLQRPRKVSLDGIEVAVAQALQAGSSRRAEDGEMTSRRPGAGAEWWLPVVGMEWDPTAVTWCKTKTAEWAS